MYRRASPDSRSMKTGNGNIIKMCGEEVMGKSSYFVNSCIFIIYLFIGHAAKHAGS